MRRLLIIVLLFIICIGAFASPARYGRVMLTQPDGTCFYALFRGDEFIKIKTTESGESIIQESDGWWCYANYDNNGLRTSTGYHVGKVVPSDILSASRNIPYAILSNRAVELRAEAEYRRFQRNGELLRLQSVNEFQAEKAGLVILVQFNGGETEKFQTPDPKSKFTALLTQNGYSVNGATGSAKEYFDQQYKGKSQFTFEVTDVVTLSHERSYYGGNDKNGNDLRAHEMVVEACQLVVDKVDFKKFDQDGNGEVDNVFVFYAGLDEASGADEDHIWSHSWYIKDGANIDLELDEVTINRYACTSELEGNSYKNPKMTGIGTFCHEYSHTLGLPDLYDTDYSTGGFSAGVWRYTALMDGGNANNSCNTPPYFNAIEREILNLSQSIVIDAPGTYELPPINEGVYYRINTTTDDEYFLIEYRDGKSWDEYIGGSGVLVYHIDKANEPAGYSNIYKRNVTAAFRWANQIDVNTLAEHQCADLIEADGRTDQFSTDEDIEYRNLLRSLRGLFFPYNGKNALTPVSTPGLKCWRDSEVYYSLTDIAVNDGKATFNVIGFSGKDMPVPINIRKDAFQDCAIISFESSSDFSETAKIVYGPTGKDTKSIQVESYESGKWAVELSDLEPTTSYSLQITFVKGGNSGDSAKVSFMTKKREEGAMPYIYFGSVDRNENGTFKNGSSLPLKVFNAHQAQEIVWKFNGATIYPDKNMYYNVSKSGKLEAYICWEDGSEDVIIKDIRVKSYE